MSPPDQPLPARLEIVPRSGAVAAVVHPPGSKSLTNRALVTAALARGVSRLLDPLEADDTRAMREGLRALGVSIDDVDDPWLVLGSAGEMSAPEQPIDAYEAGTVARFLTAVAALVPGRVTITGRGRLPHRPLDELGEALIQLGCKVEHGKESLPVTVTGVRLGGGTVTVDPSRSSQFVSALLLISPLATETMEIVLTAPPVSRHYLTSTLEVMTAFGATVEDKEDRFLVEPSGYRSVSYRIEADASAAVYPLVAAAITAGHMVITGIPESSTQPDLRVLDVLAAMGCRIERGSGKIDLRGPEGPLRAVDVDLSEAPDGALAMAVACLFADEESRLRGLQTLRHKESDRLAALESELRRVGGNARVEGSDLVIAPAPLRPAVVSTYGDHRIAMSLALVGLRQPGIIIDSPSVVTKTWPGYFTMLSQL
ncbi:MAG TPA: 3-phosphoshikimate 1-carboxyvinyltransferase [Acidimicrobiia bacterium]|nr:3-phosphoshikimate 1-carboxyvinyltransferase [Acidimicrobiia bacterium]